LRAKILEFTNFNFEQSLAICKVFSQNFEWIDSY